MKQNVDQILIAPRDLQLVLLVQWQYVVHPVEVTHARQVHQHHTGIDAQRAVKRMPRESIVPADVFVLVLRRQARDLAGIEILEQRPDAIDGRHEQRVGVDVQHGVGVR